MRFDRLILETRLLIWEGRSSRVLKIKGMLKEYTKILGESKGKELLVKENYTGKDVQLK